MTPLEFLEAIWGDGYHSLCGQRPGGQFRTIGIYGTPEALNTTIVAKQLHTGANIWVGLHGMAEPPEPGLRGGEEDVTSVVALAADLDWDHPAHQADGLPTEEEIRERLARLGDDLHPQIIVATGHGLQTYWLLDHDVGGELGGELQARLDAKLAELELVNERGDLASVLRLPGTTNVKLDPVPVVVERGVPGRYTPEYLSKRLPAASYSSRSRTGPGGDGSAHRDHSGILDALDAAGRDLDAKLLTLLVERHDAHHPFLARGGELYVTRPGKQSGTSASIGTIAPGLVKVFSANWPPFGQGRVYDIDEVLAFADRADDADDRAADYAPPRLTFQHLPDPLVITPLQWHARGLWSRGTYGEIAGPEKSLKSYLSTALAVALTAGVPVLGRWPVDDTQRVLMMIGEGGVDGFHRRLTRIAGAYGVALAQVRPNLRYTWQTAPVSSAKFGESVREQLADFNPDVVMLDPWYAYAPGDVDARNLYEQGAALDRLGSMITGGGASLLISNHFNQTGNGAGLQRISMAGHAEWCDSWLLVNHRTAPDVDAGRFRLKLNVGSRQWGGAEHHVDFDIGRWDDELNDHVGALRWKVTAAVDDDGADPVEVKVADYEARLISTWRRRRGAKTPWTQSEWFDRTTGSPNDKRVAFLRLVDLGRIAEVPSIVVDSAGRIQPSGRFVLVESPFETGDE